MNADFYSPETEKLKSKINRITSQIGKNADLKKLKEELITLSEELKALNLSFNDRQMVRDMMSMAFDKIRHQQSIEQQSFEQEAERNYHNLKIIFTESLTKFASVTDLYEKKNILIVLQDQMRGTKLKREHREELYARIQSEFDMLNKLRDMEKDFILRESNENYALLKRKVSDAVASAGAAENYDDAREILSAVQSELRETRLTREHRDELFSVIQAAYDKARLKREEILQKDAEESARNYHTLKPLVEHAVETALKGEHIVETKKKLLELQNQVRAVALSRNQRNDLWDKINVGFTHLRELSASASESYVQDTRVNYLNLKKKVDEAVRQAHQSSEFKQTRHYLIAVQNDFRGLPLKQEDREELYTRLQQAFATLNNRVDEYFRERKKYWNIQMQYKISSLENDIYLLEKDINSIQEEIGELEIQRQAADNEDDHDAVADYNSRLDELHEDILEKTNEKEEMLRNLDELYEKYNPETDQADSEQQ